MNGTAKTPIEDLRRDALEGYDKGASCIHSYRSDIPRAINFYYDHYEDNTITPEQEWINNIYAPVKKKPVAKVVGFEFEDGELSKGILKIDGKEITLDITQFIKKTDKMKVVYIAHPISGDVEGNIEKISEILRTINLEQPDVVPIAPYLADLKALNDEIPEERAKGIANNKVFFERNMIDELWVYGDPSPGVQAEVKLADENNIPVCIHDKDGGVRGIILNVGLPELKYELEDSEGFNPILTETEAVALNEILNETTFRKAKQKQVIDAILSERCYQEEQKKQEDSHVVEDFPLSAGLEAIRYNLNIANQLWYETKKPYEDAMDYIRKIAAICVQMGETYKMKKRQSW